MTQTQIFPAKTMSFVNQLVLDTGVILTGHGQTVYDSIRATEALMKLEKISSIMFLMQIPNIEREVLYQEDKEETSKLNKNGYKAFKILDQWDLEKEEKDSI